MKILKLQLVLYGPSSISAPRERSDAVVTPAKSLKGKGSIDFSAPPTIKPPAGHVLIDSPCITTGPMCKEAVKTDEPRQSEPCEDSFAGSSQHAGCTMARFSDAWWGGKNV